MTTKQKTEATKRPWRTDSTKIYNQQGALIVNTPIINVDVDVAIANARLIVKAVNNHDKLVEALKGLLNIIHDDLTHEYQDRRAAHINKAKQTLKQAEESEAI